MCVDANLNLDIDLAVYALLMNLLFILILQEKLLQI
jgi:hypothetical protein